MCTGYEKLRRHDDTNEACPLWREATDKAQRRVWAEQQHNETISRASAPSPRVAGTTTT